MVALRARQARNLMVALLVAHGVPMLHMGDEYGHSKGGNNNTYCHDLPINYFDWRAAGADHDGLLRFTRHVIALRCSADARGACALGGGRSRRGGGELVRRRRTLEGLAAPRCACAPLPHPLHPLHPPCRHAHRELRRTSYITDAEVEWHGVEPSVPDWSEASRFLGYTLRKPSGGGLYIAFNTSHTAQMVELPRWEGRLWQLAVDTSKVPPQGGRRGGSTRGNS